MRLFFFQVNLIQYYKKIKTVRVLKCTSNIALQKLNFNNNIWFHREMNQEQKINFKFKKEVYKTIIQIMFVLVI